MVRSSEAWEALKAAHQRQYQGSDLESQGSCIFTSIRGRENCLVGTLGALAGQFSDPGCPTWAQFSDPLLFVVGIEPILLKLSQASYL